jgi:hypothetical protein
MQEEFRVSFLVILMCIFEKCNFVQLFLLVHAMCSAYLMHPLYTHVHMDLLDGLSAIKSIHLCMPLG